MNWFYLLKWRFQHKIKYCFMIDLWKFCFSVSKRSIGFHLRVFNSNHERALLKNIVWAPLFAWVMHPSSFLDDFFWLIILSSCSSSLKIVLKAKTWMLIAHLTNFEQIHRRPRKQIGSSRLMTNVCLLTEHWICRTLKVL